MMAPGPLPVPFRRFLQDALTRLEHCSSQCSFASFDKVYRTIAKFVEKLIKVREIFLEQRYRCRRQQMEAGDEICCADLSH